MAEVKIVAEGSLITDINESYAGKDVLTYALNRVDNTHQGDAYFISNEPSNIPCMQAPYKIIGRIAIKNNRWVIFSTDNISSEIGIGNENTCEYKKVISADCLNFSTDAEITGQFKENDKGQEIITFQDRNNPVRRLNLQDIPYTYTFDDDACESKIYTNQLACEETLLFRQIGIPQIALDEGYGGNLENGMYSVVIAYYIEGQKYGDYYGLTLPIPLWSGEDSSTNALDIEITGLDREFDQFEVIVIRDISGTTEYKRAGLYSTSTEKVRITDLGRADNTPIDVTELVVNRKVWDKAGFVSGNSEYLILADLSTKPRVNLQNQVRDVKIEYVVHQRPLNYYYDDGEDVGYWRDENYCFFLAYVYTTGDRTEHVHLFGRVAEDGEKAPASGEDLYEVLEPGFDERIEVWQKENTASVPIDMKNEFKDDQREFGFGKPGYHESSELYPDNEELFGEDACTPVRFVRMPDEQKVPRYSVYGDKTYINILGVRFKNIPYPIGLDGKPVPGIVGYEIYRGNRLMGGNRTVVARGIMTNARGYTDTQNQNLEVVYANYPVNDLRPDQFISTKQTTHKGSRERNFSPLSRVYNDKFNFYTPHAYFGNKYRMGEEFVFETYETGRVDGFFDEVANHPKDKLLTDFSLYFALVMGAIQGLLSVTPRVDKRTRYEYEGKLSVPPAATVRYEETADTYDEIGNSPIFSLNLSAAAQYNVFQIAKRVLQTIAKLGMFVYFAAEYASNVLKIIKSFSQLRQYAYQYNSVVHFNQQAPVIRGNRIRKAIRVPEYLSSENHTIGNRIINNIGRPRSIFVEVNKEIGPPIGDNSRVTLREANTTINSKIQTTGSVLYATSKIKNPSQYGRLDSVSTIKTHNSPFPITLTLDQFNVAATTDTPAIFGGDCIIAQFAVLNKMPFFSQNLVDSNLPDGTLSFDYRMYRSVGYPRFWVDYSDYEIGDLITRNPSEGGLPSNKFNLDGKPTKKNSTEWSLKDNYFYLYSNCALNFIAEADYNISFREKGTIPFYSTRSSNLTQIFHSKNLKEEEEFKLNPAFKKIQANEFYSQHLPLDFNSLIESQVRTRDRNGLIYSLPSFEGQTIDNWQYFLPGNYHSFSNTDFGNLTGIHKLDQDKVIFLFDKASPYILPGRDQLETVGGTKVTIGDGGLFAHSPRELIHTDVAYGASQSRYAFTSTQFGAFYPSARQGRIFGFSGGLDDITRQGMSKWCKEYMPIKLFDYFPEYILEETPSNGIGYISAFDSSNEVYYLTKRDVIPQPGMIDNIEYDKTTNKFLSGGREISLGDDNYFKDVSWTLSYSPAKKGFISFHSWIPDAYVQTETHFMTIKGNTFWKHNEATNSFCNFYGKDHSYQIEHVINTGDQVSILSSLEFIFEAYKYKNDGRDKFHVYGDFYSHGMVYNSEQCSGMLAFNLKPNDIYAADAFGGFNRAKGAYDIVYSKVENRYRFNDFMDITADRGKYPPNNEYPIWINKENGWERMLNPKAINYNKPQEERKRFRHYLNRVWLAKDVSGSTKYLSKFLKATIKQSPR